MTPPLRSTTITVPSTLLRAASSLDGTSVLSALLCELVPFPWHCHRRFPQFHKRARNRITLPLCRTPCGPSAGSVRTDPGATSLSGFDVVLTVSTIERQFTVVRLPVSHLTPFYGAFSSSLTTTAFDRRRIRWFVTSTCMPMTRGHNPSSLPQLAAAH